MKIKTNNDAFKHLEISVLTEMIGKTFARVESTEDTLHFFTDDNKEVRFYHSQDCCESVGIQDICGDLSDLIGNPILQAEEVYSGEDCIRELYYDDSHTWTFYRFATLKGSVVVRWLGISNGYYSESVDVEYIGFND